MLGQPSPEKEAIRDKIAAHIEDYHQRNFWNIFPAGRVQPWVLDAVTEYVTALQDEIATLKAQLELVK